MYFHLYSMLCVERYPQFTCSSKTGKFVICEHYLFVKNKHATETDKWVVEKEVRI